MLATITLIKNANIILSEVSLELCQGIAKAKKED
jgi:hypothetical protein